MKSTTKITLLMVAVLCIGAGSLQAAPVYGVKYGTVVAPLDFVSFDTSTPLAQTVINGAIPFNSYGYALDFNPAGTVLYALQGVTHAIGTIDTTTGAFTPTVTVTGILGGLPITGMKIDPTTGMFYAVSIHPGTGSTLYSLDPSTGVVTPLGSQSTAPEIVELAISANGQMYATDLWTSSLYSIDKTNGAATLIGSLGFGAGLLAQGMDFDYGSGVLYAALRQSDNSSRWATLDLTTGAATILADLGSGGMDIAIGNPVPVPGAIALVGSGLLSLAAMRRKLAK